MNELQILEALLSLLTVVVGAVVSVYSPKIKQVIDAHLSAKEAMIANHVIDGLGSISEAVVQEFNQKVVVDSKANGVFTNALAQSIKKDAIQSVKDQGSPLISLGDGVIGNIDDLISGLVEKAVVNNHVPTAKRAPVNKQPTASSVAAVDVKAPAQAADTKQSVQQ